MIADADRRAAHSLVPGLRQGALGLLRAAPLSGLSSGALAVRTPAVSQSTVPWTALDVLRVCSLVLLSTIAGVCLFVVVRILLSVGFLFGEGFGLVRTGTYDRLCRVLAPYSAAITTGLVGLLIYGSLLFAVYRIAVGKYRQPWSALGFRHVGWRVYGAVATLFVPLILCGLFVTRIETALLGGSLDNPQTALLTRGMPALPLNFAVLFLLLGILIPVAEELFFRGFLYRLLRKRLPVWAAASVSAAAFALSHGIPVLFPWLFLLGVVFALVAERTRSIIPSILLHSMTNGLATLAIVVALAGW